MKPKPILFSTPMVQAILNGRKTMTRRVIKQDGWQQWIAAEADNAPYRAGDILWVRETWRERWGMAYANYGCGSAYPIDEVREIEFKAGGNGFFMRGCNLCPDEPTVKWGEWSKWRPSIFMPRKAARIYLRVTCVRAEHLQEITPEDVHREGLETELPSEDAKARFPVGSDEMIGVLNWCNGYSQFIFHELWDNLNAKRGYGWDTNPWVWVISFERCEKPGDFCSYGERRAQ